MISASTINRLLQFIADLIAAYNKDFGVTLPVPPNPGPVAPPAPPIPGPQPTPAPPAPVPVAGGDPPWLVKARTYVGFHEQGDNNGLGEFISGAHCGAEGDPWCAIFANFCLETSGVPGTRSALARSFETNPNFVKLDTHVVGCITTMWRGSPGSGTGHVTICTGEQNGKIMGLGGNQNDQVCIEPFPEDAHITGYWWPRNYPLATLPGAVGTVEATPGQRFTGIKATCFGGSSDRETSAYDGHVIGDNELCCALPFRFHGQPPSMQVYANGNSVTLRACDVGPWNVNDPYWETGSRPQAESGTDKTGRKTNGAGIDLSPQAVVKLGLAPNAAAASNWSGVVDWEFDTGAAPAPAPVTITTAPAAMPLSTAIAAQIDVVGAALAALKALVAPPAPPAPPAPEVRVT
jgi:uncharacterized protein (TIGR02594 family)